MGPRRARRLEGLVQSDIRRMSLHCAQRGGINLAQGVADLPLPAVVRDAAIAALYQRTNTYSSARGIPSLREALAEKLRRDSRLWVDPETEIVVTTGVTGGLSSAILGLVDPGDGVLLPEPYYGYHRNLAASAGAEVQLVHLEPPYWQLTLAALRDALRPNSRMLILSSPSNPVGRVYSEQELQAVAQVAAERDLIVLSDEIYEHFVYDGRLHRATASISDLWPRTVSLFGASKVFAVTGWRIGWAVGPAPLLDSLLLAHDLHYICAPRPLQHAVDTALRTLEPQWFEALAVRFQRKRDRLCTALSAAGLNPIVPEGAYYAWCDIRDLGYDSALTAAMDLLDRRGVATVPGTAFCGAERSEHYLRVCFAKEDHLLDEACRRLATFSPEPVAA